MRARRLAVLSTTALPRFLGPAHPASDDLFAEDDLVLAACAERGVHAERIAWRRNDVDFAQFDLAVIRSTWDYIDDVAGFLRALAAIEASGCPLVNPLSSVRWNYDKGYLSELAAAVPVVPGHVIDLEDGEARDVWSMLDALPAVQGYVLKPTVGVGACATQVLTDLAQMREALTQAQAQAQRRWLVQPFLPSVPQEGEWSFVFLNGALAYTVRKVPRAGDFRVQVMYGAQTHVCEPAPADRAAAEAALAALPVPACYARIDMARLPDGRLALMEAELIEPQLFFPLVAGSAARFAEAVLAWSG